MPHHLRRADQGNIEHRPSVDFFQQLLGFFEQSLHGYTFHSFEFQPGELNQLINTFDLAVRLLKVGSETSANSGLVAPFAMVIRRART